MAVLKSLKSKLTRKSSMETTKIPIIPNPNYRRCGTKSYLHLMRKYRFNPTKAGPYCLATTMLQTGRPYTNKPIGGRAHARQILQKRNADTNRIGQVDADDVQNDARYLAQVGIGTPAQVLSLDFDTASADLWVWSMKLPSVTLSQQHKNHTIFDPTRSSSFKDKEGSIWRLAYGDGSSASGTVGHDNVHLGGVVVRGQAIELADSMSAQFARGAGDGLLGLAFGSINTVKPHAVKTSVENMLSQSNIPKSAALFTAKLGSWSDGVGLDQGESFWTFGFVDQDTVQAMGGEIHYTPVDKSQGFWMVNSASARVNANPVLRTGNKAIVDTGTSLALVDDSTCEAIYDAIEGACYDEELQGYLIPSNTPADKLPDVSLAVGDQQFVFQKEDLGFAPARHRYLYGGIQSRGSMDVDILGDTFLKGIYAIFDVRNLRFGAVQRKELRQNALSLP